MTRDTFKAKGTPAAARWDVWGLVARVAQLREAIESEPDHCFGVNMKAGRAYGVRENLLCIVGLIESALASEGEICETDLRGVAVTQAGGAEVLRLRTDNSESFRDAAILANIRRDEAEARAERLAEALRTKADEWDKRIPVGDESDEYSGGYDDALRHLSNELRALLREQEEGKEGVRNG